MSAIDDLLRLVLTLLLRDVPTPKPTPTPTPKPSPSPTPKPSPRPPTSPGKPGPKPQPQPVPVPQALLDKIGRNLNADVATRLAQAADARGNKQRAVRFDLVCLLVTAIVAMTDECSEIQFKIASTQPADAGMKEGLYQRLRPIIAELNALVDRVAKAQYCFPKDAPQRRIKRPPSVKRRFNETAAVYPGIGRGPRIK